MSLVPANICKSQRRCHSPFFWLSRSIQSILLHKKEGPQRRCGFGTRSTEVSNEQKNGARDGKQYAQTYKREQINKLHAQFPVPLLICEAPVCLASLINMPTYQSYDM